MHKFKIKKGDKVQVITGKDKGMIGEVIRLITKENRLVVSGVNFATKHVKPSQKSDGGIIRKEMPIHVSNVSHVEPSTNKITKICYKLDEQGKKRRMSKRSGEVI